MKSPLRSRILWLCTVWLCLAECQAPGALANIQAVAQDNTAFAFDLYQREKGRSDNLFFSPCSISTALAITYAGARGQTAEEIARTAHFTQPVAELSVSFAGLADRFDQIQTRKQIALSVANSLWCQRDFPFLPEFLQLNSNDYRVELRSVDFAHQSEAARQEINAWVEHQTHDKIRDLLKPGDLSSMTRLLICNAIYFKGNWAAPFDPKATLPEPFFTVSGHSVQVPMMTRQFRVRSRALEDSTIFALPYSGGDLSMVILLPKEKDGLAALEGHLNSGAFSEWLKALNGAPETEAIVSLPKFKLNCRLELASDLAAMGMPSAFTTGADFSGMDGKRDLFVSAVVHQAFVDVNEEGTEAAAATGITMRTLAMIRPIPLRVDRPFLFCIVERQTGSVLFLGRVTNPVSNP